ncbi:DHH family phosphoesterase [Viridibacillus arvi]|uniref:DHH family phosphoesterase n=1 Tax=Viridibacillus arvi TaxID=263475 RepID=UPI0034CE433D
MQTTLINSKPKAMTFSHNDLDGAGCGIVTKLAYPSADIVYCGYHNIDEKVTKFITDKEYEKYDLVFITDISVNKEVEELINSTTELRQKIKLFDHHATAMHLNQNEWAFVSPNGFNGKNSGTNMLYEFLKMDGFFKNEIYRDALEVFVEKIRRYDTWEWKEIYDDIEASSLNDLFWLYGLNKFNKTFINRLLKLDICIVRDGTWINMFNDTDFAVLTVDYDKKVAYINRKDKQMFSGRLVGMNTGFVFAEQYISELGNELADRHPELDFITIIDLGNKKVSYRTVKNVDLGKDVASHFGGGGHPKASGSQIDVKNIKMIIPLIFGSIKLHKKLVSVITGKGLLGTIGKVIDKITK